MPLLFCHCFRLSAKLMLYKVLVRVVSEFEVHQYRPKQIVRRRSQVCSNATWGTESLMYIIFCADITTRKRA